MKIHFSLTILLCFLIYSPRAHSQVVFHYQAFQGGGKDLPNVPDSGPGANDGTADETTKFNSSIAEVGVPMSAGNRSFDGKGLGGIVSGGTSELSNSAIADAGGFTMETWFNWNGAGAINSLIDYAGTEKIVLDTAQGAGNEVRMRINSDSALDSVIGTVGADEWHYVAAVFDTQGNTVDAGSITGIFRLYLDGSLTDTTDSLTISDFGDSLNRTIGVGKHPLNFEGDRFDGLIFEPRVSLGALSQSELLFVPEPGGFVLMVLGALISFRCFGKRRSS